MSLSTSFKAALSTYIYNFYSTEFDEFDVK